ncbi:MAG: DNA repair protein RecO [Planctomycetes bacterium]|nr:DNA repair protein RecO [Planctomycetota bacterium]
MEQLKCNALIIGRNRFSETSLVVWLFTRELGRLDCIAKGCRREKSPMRGHLDLFNLEEVVVVERSRGSLDLVTDSDVTEEFVGLRSNYLAYAGACILGNMITASCMLRDPHPATFDSFVSFLRLSAAEGSDSVCTLLLKSMLDILRDTGFQPRLDECVSCGKKTSGLGGMSLSASRGGLVCSECVDKSHGFGLDAGLVASLNYIANANGNAKSVVIGRKKAYGLIQALIDYSEHSLGKKIKSADIFLRLLKGATN